MRGRIHTYIDDEIVKGTDTFQITPQGTVLLSEKKPVGRPACIIQSTKFQLETPAEYLHQYSNLVREGRKKELQVAVNLLAQKIADAEILTNDTREPYLSVVMENGRRLPVHDLGDGAVRLVRLLLSFSASRDGILLVDEMENGIHHSAQREIWDRAREWMDQWNTQFMATTHSGEFIDAAIDAFKDAPEDLSIHHLFCNGNTGHKEAATFTGETLIGARDLNLEVR